MTPPINIDGSTVQDITIDNQTVQEVTLDGQVVFSSFPPDSQDIHARYDAAALSANDGDSISSLPDESGNGFDLNNQGTPTSTFQSGLINSTPGLDMASGEKLFETNSLISQPYTVFFVGSLKSTGGSKDQLIAGGVQPSGGSIAEKAGSYRLLAGNFPNLGTSDTNLHVLSALFDGSSSIFRIDGSEFTGVNAGTNSLQDVGLNGDSTGNNGRSPGIEFGEMLIYDKDKSAIFADVEAALQNRNGF